MAMSVPSEWEWININRDNDVSIAGGSTTAKGNWTMTRRRIFDGAYSGQLGATATSISAKNGTRTETVTAPTVQGVMFNTNTAWCTTTGIWIPNGYMSMGQPVYVLSNEVNIPVSTCQNLCFIVLQNATQNKYWCCIEADASEVKSGSFFTGYWWIDGASPYKWPQSPNTVTTSASGSMGSINGKSFSVNYGSFTGDASASLGTRQLSLLCTSDQQIFQQGCEWYVQQQTWVYKSSWGTA